MKICVDKI